MAVVNRTALTRSGWCALALVVGIASALHAARATLPAPQSTSLAAAQLVQLYADRDYGAVRAAFAQVTDFEVFRHEVSKAVAHERPQIAAAFMIEVADAAYETPLVRSGDIVSRVRAARALLEDGCALVRQLPPGSEFERRWQLVSLALLEGEDPRLGLIKLSDVRPYDPHWQHLRQRGADPGILALSKGVDREGAVGRFFKDTGFGIGELSDTSEARAHLVHDGQVAVREAVSALTTARSFPNVSVEATVRLGFLANASQQLSVALGSRARSERTAELLSDIDVQTNDPRLRYLGHLFLARANEQNHDPAAAALEYRRAVTALPGQSAIVSLAALVYLSGHALDSGDLVRGITSERAAPDDPWLTYFSGASRELPARLAGMREAVR